MALINIEKDNTTYSVNTQNVTYIAKFDEQTQTFQVFVDGYDNAFIITEDKYQEFLAADYSGGGGGQGGSEVSFDDENQTITIDGVEHQINQYDDTEVKADITTLNGWVKDGWEETDALEITAHINPNDYTIGVSQDGFVPVSKDVYQVTFVYTLTEESIKKKKLLMNVVVDSVYPNHATLLIKKSNGLVIPNDFKFQIVTNDNDTKGYKLYNATDASISYIGAYYRVLSTVYNNTNGFAFLNAGSSVPQILPTPLSYNGLLDRVSALENKPESSSMVYNTTTGVLSGAKDQDGNDYDFEVGTITIQF